MKKFKKIYIEITNFCNLNCSFCSDDKILKQEVSLDNFEHILKEIDDYTDYIYLHVKGEPLLHSKFEEILKLCLKYNKKVNITTNGILLFKNTDIILNSNVVRQINISMQSIINLNYLDDILDSVLKINNNSNIQIVFRFWAIKDNKFSKLQENIIEKIIEKFKIDKNIIDSVYKDKNIKLMDRLYLNKDIQFTWPSLEMDAINTNGTCYGTRTHIAILVNGDIVPCCLDSSGINKFGNIYEDGFKTIIESDNFNNVRTCFQNDKLVLDLCKRCDYINRFKTSLKNE